jgi:hypothetical protein
MSNKGTWFCWQRGTRGPAPVLYHDGIPGSAKTEILIKYEITEIIPLDDLVKRHPAPKTEYEVENVRKSESRNSGPSGERLQANAAPRGD